MYIYMYIYIYIYIYIRKSPASCHGSLQVRAFRHMFAICCLMLPTRFLHNMHNITHISCCMISHATI